MRLTPYYQLRMSYNGISNSLSELERDAKKLGDKKLMELIDECYFVDVKIKKHIDETYDNERKITW